MVSLHYEILMRGRHQLKRSDDFQNYKHLLGSAWCAVGRGVVPFIFAHSYTWQHVIPSQWYPTKATPDHQKSQPYEVL